MDWKKFTQNHPGSPRVPKIKKASSTASIKKISRGGCEILCNENNPAGGLR